MRCGTRMAAPTGLRCCGVAVQSEEVCEGGWQERGCMKCWVGAEAAAWMERERERGTACVCVRERERENVREGGELVWRAAAACGTDVSLHVAGSGCSG